MGISSAQCRAGRALIGWSQDQLAMASKVAKATIANFEAGKRAPYDRTLLDLQAALETAGVEFIPENGGGAGVRLKKSAPPSAQLREGEAGIIENNEM
ncbi:XRE family transcriptional regulator (modular protein) [Mesorhizobium prunaredense]|uniref:XRE family transcriptional regulator (Modular protein) n=1 Tax=Mesorhizobium prunaredense TaxID=1631249 RepID=A0A1R3V1P5_9HYPH|nr:helix-turn-helix transcriptional regulator [Mesorhizobium prunaredense]SIT53136.1 XRE family transcriptional regulator (modular protein) [Mesorhizobium prunaredense]